MKRISKFSIFVYLLFALFSVNSYAQQQYIYQLVTPSLTATGSATSANIIASGAAFHNLTWYVSGTVTTCSVRVDSSVDGVTWNTGDVISSKTCTSDGNALSASIIVNYVRINLTTLTGAGATFTANLSGFITAPSGGGTLTSVTCGTGMTGGTITSTGTCNVDTTIIAPLASPTFTGTPAAPTPTVSDSTTKLATTAYVRNNGQSSYLTSLYTNATTTFSNVTGLSFAVAANTNYKIECNLDYQTSATTADIKIQWTGPASPTFLVYDLNAEITSSTFSVASNPATATTTGAFSTALSAAGTPTITTNFPVQITLTLINGSTAGTVQLQAAATGTGTISILPGSCSLQQ